MAEATVGRAAPASWDDLLDQRWSSPRRSRDPRSRSVSSLNVELLSGERVSCVVGEKTIPAID